MDCFVACAPRNDVETHFRILAVRCARGLPRNSRPLQSKGAGNAGRPMRPAVSCAMIVVDAHTSIQVTPESPGTPRAVVYGLCRAHLGDRAFCHRHPQRLSCELDTSVGVSGPHDFARPHQMRSSVAPSASTAARPANVTIAYRPFWWDGMIRNIGQLRQFCKSEYFFKRRLTGSRVICPSGQNHPASTIFGTISCTSDIRSCRLARHNFSYRHAAGRYTACRPVVEPARPRWRRKTRPAPANLSSRSS